MATYSSDLTTLTDAESGTWTEFASPYNGGGSPGLSGENFIQGVDCYAQNSGKANGLEISIVFDSGAGQTFAADEVLFSWCFYAVGTNLETYANSGWRYGIGSSASAWSWYKIGGSDYGRNPYGGWANFAIDPTATATGTVGGGNGGTYQFFGNVPYTIAEITKGDPTASDAIRIGRGEISVTGTGGSFAELASYNDYNAGGTPPGTSSTSIDTGRHRLGLFQEQGGTYLWKGLMSLGITATTVTFSDSNETIIIDDSPHTYLDFNKIEVNHASSSVTLTNITFISTSTVSPGTFEMVDNATVTKTGCAFNSMGTFTYLSNATVDNCVFNTCGLVTVGGGSFDGCVFNNPSGTIGATAATPANAALISNTEFVSDGTGNGLEVNGTAADFTLTGVDFTDYSTTVDADKAIYVNIATGTVNITVSGGSGVTLPSHVRTAGATINVIAGAVTVKATAITDTGTLIQNARVMLKASDATGSFPFEESVTITRATTTATVTHTTHGLATNDYVVIADADQEEYNLVVQITVTDANTYTYVIATTPVSPATGTITSTFVALYGLTDALGVVSTSRVYASAQPVIGYGRKSSAAPFYKQGSLGGSVDIASGYNKSSVMVLDQ